MADTPTPSGEGSRPTTDGTVDNIGAGGKFDVGHAATGEPNEGPANPEGMQDKRADADAAEHDDSVPLGLHGDQHAQTNQEPPEHGG
ncbi:hypothetical protein [Pseudorhodoferax sp. Leaf267]|uniref:hypothetical protein n=1 Tax=Pseudorhodoferax sp. Leaf267 TaxID=1736316 RepID=UPI0006F40E32|nr:hypothetical protein [Pseudorhodoferax sp. Leaf267]KQP23341.1 hypothetical protein ASF43_05625 [Pseudorhodoferax sp. Leaf267]